MHLWDLRDFFMSYLQVRPHRVFAEIELNSRAVSHVLLHKEIKGPCQIQ